MTHFVIDTSVVGRMSASEVGQRVSSLIRRRDVALCSPVEFELSLTATSSADLDQIRSDFLGLPRVRTHQAHFDRALEVQAELAGRGQHRGLSLVDLLVAAVAEAGDLTVWHYDSDFDRIAGVTGQPTEWVVPAGSVP